MIMHHEHPLEEWIPRVHVVREREEPSMKSLQIILPGRVEPEALIAAERDVQEPAPGKLLVRLEATGVSFAEVQMRRGRYPGQPPFPFVPGYDLVGTVVAIGAG